MQRDASKWWQETGQRFEEFKPTSESKVPTEWWIPIYLIQKTFVWSLWKTKAMESDGYSRKSNSRLSSSETSVQARASDQDDSDTGSLQVPKFEGLLTRLRRSFKKNGDIAV